MITIEEANEFKPNSEDISLFEEEIGIVLPLDYIAFLKEYNGGYPEPNYYQVGKYCFIVQFFSGLHLESIEDLRREVEVFAGRIPSKSLPIAAMEGGDVLIMALDKKHYGQLYWWEHEIEDNRVDELRLVANSFSEFIEQLMPDLDEE